uniref:Uncharacterized protein n=1 Tax=Oryza meridionalis TaxID=40149 RepID=A0A0E0DNY2_9ORYZ
MACRICLPPPDLAARPRLLGLVIDFFLFPPSRHLPSSVVAQGCGLAAPVAAAVQGRGSAAPGAAAARWLLSAAVARDLHGGEVARRLGEEQQKRPLTPPSTLITSVIDGKGRQGEATMMRVGGLRRPEVPRVVRPRRHLR